MGMWRYEKNTTCRMDGDGNGSTREEEGRPKRRCFTLNGVRDDIKEKGL